MYRYSSTCSCHALVAFAMMLVLLSASSSGASNVHRKDELFNFDGDYGKEYRTFIRNMIPGYDHFLEMTGDILSATDVKTALVIGPGHGEELVTIAKALPDIIITAYESSKEMAKACQQLMEAHNLTHQVTIYNEAFQAESDCGDTQYDAVTMFNVLHFLQTEEQGSMLRSAASRLAPSGVLLVSGMSVPSDYSDQHPLTDITMKRWERLGIDSDQAETIRNGVGKAMFNIVPEKMNFALEGLRMSKFEEVFRGLGNAMWYTYKQENNEG